jgi:DNA modification methylase
MQITPYEKNAKKHPEAQLRQLALSLREYGWRQPIVVDKDNVIIVGHGRYMAYQKYPDGIAEPWVVKADDLTHEQVKGYRLMDNKSNESDWDMELVVEELKELDEANFPIELTGFDSDLLIYPEDKDDEIPDNAPTRAQLGDIWQLGEHRVMCGDSTKQEDVQRLMNGKKADMSFTSPPYNVGENSKLSFHDSRGSKYINSDDNLAEYQDLIVKSTDLALQYAKECFVNLQILANNKKDVLQWAANLADCFKDIFFWKKQTVQPSMAYNVANSQTEVIFLFGKSNSTRSWGNKRFRGDFSNCIETKSASGENKNSEVHNATFPVELPLKFITHGYEEGSLILDLFLGTGTTLIAAEKTGRICYGMELDPKYVDVIIKRWEEYTGKVAIKL